MSKFIGHNNVKTTMRDKIPSDDDIGWIWVGNIDSFFMSYLGFYLNNTLFLSSVLQVKGKG